MALKFTDDNFESEVVKSDKMVLVDFYADWCGPCKMMSPIVDEIATELEDCVKVGKVDVDHAPGVARQYGVMNIPTFLLVKDGEVVERVVGGMPKAKLVELINQHK